MILYQLSWCRRLGHNYVTMKKMLTISEITGIEMAAWYNYQHFNQSVDGVGNT